MLLGLLLLPACVTTQRVKLDPRIPHQVSQPVNVMVWSEIDGKAIEVPARLDAGWWVASPVLLEH
jgi:hypothetical protein